MPSGENNKSHDICMWNDDPNCDECKLKSDLQCHREMRYTIWFSFGFLLAFIPIIIGLFFGLFFGNLNLLLFLIGAVGELSYLIFFFLIWEPRMLCSHCPYYAENSKILHCYANYGFLKTAKFDPNPLSKSEKIQFIIGILIFMFYPIPFLIIGLVGWQYIILGISLIGILTWFIVLHFKICTDCVNFSCPLNRVHKDIVDDFLNKNPVMKKAWLEKGYA